MVSSRAVKRRVSAEWWTRVHIFASRAYYGILVLCKLLLLLHVSSSGLKYFGGDNNVERLLRALEHVGKRSRAWVMRKRERGRRKGKEKGKRIGKGNRERRGKGGKERTQSILRRQHEEGAREGGEEVGSGHPDENLSCLRSKYTPPPPLSLMAS